MSEGERERGDSGEKGCARGPSLAPSLGNSLATGFRGAIRGWGEIQGEKRRGAPRSREIDFGSSNFETPARQRMKRGGIRGRKGGKGGSVMTSICS